MKLVWLIPSPTQKTTSVINMPALNDLAIEENIWIS